MAWPEGQVQLRIRGRLVTAEWEGLGYNFHIHTWRHADGRLFNSQRLEHEYSFWHTGEVVEALKEGAAASADRY